MANRGERGEEPPAHANEKQPPGESFRLERGGTTARRSSTARRAVRVLLLGVILLIVWQRGATSGQLLGVGLALVWALLLPWILRATWSVTKNYPPTVRYAILALAALALLASFAIGVRPLVGF